MIETIQSYRSEGFDPHFNLAAEEHLLRTVAPGCCILYLWQNQNTVVIGRNQNPWKECHVTRINQDGVHLARRLSGGGAVYHDLGNLNFTFLVSDADYDLEKQMSVILLAFRNLGIQAECSGRNDILVNGLKCSGNAFYRHQGHAYHHGTLLVNVDTARMGRYLNPSKAKLAYKGVDSVRARVGNLAERVPTLTVPQLEQALLQAFQSVYGLPVQILSPDALDSTAVDSLYRRNQSWEWIYGRPLPFTFACEGQFDWGGIQLQLQVEGGIVQGARVYSDAMDWQTAPALEQSLTGCRFVLPDLQARVTSCCRDISPDICRLLQEQEL